jgi:hypothetical protein
MKKEDLINFTFQKAVQNLNDEWLTNYESDDWFLFIMGLPEPEKTTYLVVIFHNQVMNGGLHQYFINRYGQFAYKTIEVLKNIKAKDTSIILQLAIEKINSDKLAPEIFRKKILRQRLTPLYESEELWNQLCLLDERYYDGDEDIVELLGNYLRQPKNQKL